MTTEEEVKVTFCKWQVVSGPCESLILASLDGKVVVVGAMAYPEYALSITRIHNELLEKLGKK